MCDAPLAYNCEWVASSVPSKKFYTEQMFVLVSMNILRLS